MGAHTDQRSAEAEFAAFAQREGTRLRRVLVAHYGVELGADAAADALRYGWEHWDRVGSMTNPVGYLYRVAQSSVRRQRRWHRVAPFPSSDGTYVDRSV